MSQEEYSLTQKRCGDVHSLEVEGLRSKVVPMYPGWPPAELPEHVYGLSHVGQPHQAGHDLKTES